jgi:mannose-6-phosphate isomerase-like protein (cupin superfamily)
MDQGTTDQGTTTSGREPVDTSVIKVDSRHSPRGEAGQVYLACGTSVAMRMWDEEQPSDDVHATRRDYETVGYVIAGRARLEIEGQVVDLTPGDSWVVPKHARHRYLVTEPFTAVEATHPPAHIHGRDEAQTEAR